MNQSAAIQFSTGVAEKLGNYVYRLIDPRNGETFYIGKGQGNRVFAHVTASKSLTLSEGEDAASVKLDRIQSILNAGLDVMHVIHRHDIPDAAILEVEAALIDAFPGLSNIQGGYGSGAKGPMSVSELNDKYALPEVDPNSSDRLVLININRLENVRDRDEIYRQVQTAWRISISRAENADYILAVVRGVVVGAFVAEEWLDATGKNFPLTLAQGESIVGRRGFNGSPASEDVWDKYVGKRGKRIVADGMKHNQNPIRYWKV